MAIDKVKLPDSSTQDIHAIRIKETTLEDEEFTYQATPVHDIADAYRIDRIKGRTLAWNQLVQNTDIPTQETNGLTFTNNGDGSITISGTSTGLSWVGLDMNFIAGHVYLFRLCPPNGGSGKYFGDTGAGIGVDFGNGVIGPCSQQNSGSQYFRFYSTANQTFNNVVFYPQLIDLTLMFGAGNEPSTVAEFEAMFPLPYYDYNPGELVNNSAEAIETTGFNIWDEQWELGYWENGVKHAGPDNIMSKNLIPVIPGEDYYIKSPGYVHIEGFDAAKQFIGFVVEWHSPNFTFTIPAGCSFVAFYFYEQGITTYANDICINLSDPSRNGTYEPHWSKVLPLGLDAIKVKDSQGNIVTVNDLASAGDVRDEIRGGKYIKRVGRVDLGTLTWTLSVQNGFNRFNAELSQTPANGTSLNFAAQINSKGYENNGKPISDNDKDRSLGYYYYTNNVYVRDDAYPTTEAFTAAMSGVYLYYGLETPVEYELVAPLPFSGKIDGYGTMRVISDNIVAPFNGDITYGCNPGQIAVDSNALMEYVNSVFDLRYYETSQPSGGMLPNREYQLGTLSGNTTFTLAAGTSGVTNHYFWSFETGSTAPTITWPSAITSWYGGSAPTINASKHYEVSVLDGVAICMEV